VTQLSSHQNTAPVSEARPQMTYARARLWLGISNVGFFVVLATVLLSLGGGSAIIDALGLAAAAPAVIFASLLGIYILFSLPGDIVGGYILPRRFDRITIGFGQFFIQWLRGAAIQFAVMLVASLILLAAAQRLGAMGFVAAAGLMMLTFVQFQLPLARFVARIRNYPAAPTEFSTTDQTLQPVVVETNDPGFVGGFTGLPRMVKLVLPANWIRVLTPAELDIQLKRRMALLATGTRMRGVLVALAWNLLGLATAIYITGAAANTVDGIVSISLCFTIWSFLGLLLLPTISRRGVYEADRQVLLNGVSRQDLEGVIRKLDQLQEDEPARPSGVEAIFHPVPSVENRLRAALQPDAGRGAYHAVRMALPLSWCCLGLLSRAVHCNCGRPSVWVMLPGD